MESVAKFNSPQGENANQKSEKWRRIEAACTQCSLSHTSGPYLRMSSFPVRISVTTFNVWGENHWPARAVSLAQTLLTIRSDVYLLQEVTPAIIKNLDENLKIYKRISDDRREGWMNESNIYWNDELLSLVDYGFGDLDMAGIV